MFHISAYCTGLMQAIQWQPECTQLVLAQLAMQLSLSWSAGDVGDLLPSLSHVISLTCDEVVLKIGEI